MKTFVCTLFSTYKMAYIDERPLEDIVYDTVLDNKYEQYVNCVVDAAEAYERSSFKTNPYNGDQTIYDVEITLLKAKKTALEKERDTLMKAYNTSFDKVVALENEPQQKMRQVEEDENEEDDDMYEVKEKKSQRMKPLELAKKKKQQQIAAGNFRTTMATLQEDILDLQKQLADVETQLAQYAVKQDIAVKCLRTLRCILQHYKENRDIEFVKKGAYFVRDYSLKLS